MTLEEQVGRDNLDIVASRIYRMQCYAVDMGRGGIDATDVLQFLKTGVDNVPDWYDEFNYQSEVTVNEFTAGGTA